MPGAWARGITRNILLLAVASLLTDVSSEIILPLLPLFLFALGADFLILGVIESVGESAVSLLKIVSGHASDRLGRRKPFVAFGYGFSTLTKSFLPVAGSWLHVLAARVGDRTGKGVRDPPRDALIAESTSPETVGKAFGFHRAMDTTGAIAGPLIVLLLLPVLTATRGEMAAFRDLFLLAVVPAFLAFLVVLLVREVRSPPKPGLRLRVGLRGLPVRLRLFILVAGLHSFANFSITFAIVLAAQVAQSAGYSVAAAQALAVFDYLLLNIVYALLAAQAGSLSDRIGRKPVLLVGYAALVAGCLGFALARDPVLLLPAFLLFGISYAFVEGTERALVADLAPRELRGTSLGTYHAAVGLGKLPSSLVAGTLATLVAPWAAFLSGAAIASVAATLLVGAFAEPKR